MPEQRQCYGGAGVQQEKTETCANHQPDLSGGERFHVPLISRNQNEQVDETEETVVDSHHSGDEAGQPPDDQYGRGVFSQVGVSVSARPNLTQHRNHRV